MPTPIPPQPRLPTGQELYDALMQQIEPELVSSVVDTLEAVHKGETDEKHAERMERYRNAFLEYDKQFDAYMQNLTQQVSDYRRTAVAAIESEDRKEEHNTLTSIGDAITA